MARVQLRRTRHDMFKRINADYYGLRDEEDGVLEKVEAEAERNIRRRVSIPGCRFSVCLSTAICCCCQEQVPSGCAVYDCKS